MSTLDETSKILTATWAVSSLERFRELASDETNGTRFDAVRVVGGRRIMLGVCVTAFDQLQALRPVLRLLPADSSLDWSSVSVAELAARATSESRIVITQRSDAESRTIAVVLMAADPDSIRKLESIFGLS